MKVLKMLMSLFLTVILGVSVTVAETQTVMMATTTSTDNTGLLDYLAPEFTKDTGIELRWTATGTGKALTLGKNCDVDILMVHAPAAEKQYVADGFGINRREIMYNDFVIIGPSDDPAGIKGKTVVNTMKDIFNQKAVFVSRGDDSGTHKKELSLWTAAGRDAPDGKQWYVQTGQGMLSTINVAAEKMGYTMTDRGTYIKYAHTRQGDAPLKILVEGDRILLNQYSVIVVNPARCLNVQKQPAQKFSDWLAGEKAQKLITDFKLLGKRLFTPNAK